MTLHMIKLSVGTDDVADLDRWQRQRLQREGRLYHMTRMAPKRAEDILPDGSIYWVIKGLVLCRQKLTGFDKAVDEAGRAMTLLILDPVLVATVPTPHRAFQGWRYLEPSRAPLDLKDAGGAGLPPELAAELRQLGVW